MGVAFPLVQSFHGKVLHECIQGTSFSFLLLSALPPFLSFSFALFLFLFHMPFSVFCSRHVSFSFSPSHSILSSPLTSPASSSSLFLCRTRVSRRIHRHSRASPRYRCCKSTRARHRSRFISHHDPTNIRRDDALTRSNISGNH